MLAVLNCHFKTLNDLIFIWSAFWIPLINSNIIYVWTLSYLNMRGGDANCFSCSFSLSSCSCGKCCHHPLFLVLSSKLEMDYFHKGDSGPNPYQNFKTSTLVICEEVFFQQLVIAILQCSSHKQNQYEDQGQGAFIDEDDDLRPNCNSLGYIASEIEPSFPAASAALMISKSIAS